MSPATLEQRAREVSWSRETTARRRRRLRAPRSGVATFFALAAGLGLGVVIALVVTSESLGDLSSPGGWFVAAGRLFAMTGTYLMLIMVILVARVPWLERSVGQDQLVRWHRTIGGWPIGLIALHIVFITLGYAKTTGSGLLSQFWVFVRHYPDILAAAVAFALLVMAGVASFRIARRHMKYETWWIVHLYIYLALGLALAHQLATGVMFIGHPLARYFWIALWIITAATVLVSRLAIPIARNLKHRLRVAAVREEAPGVYSIIISGRQLATLKVAGGQFFQWRFLTRELWWHAHPYSLSALPRPPYLRVTIKALGDQSRAVTRLRPGTRVFIEGPYGAFTPHVRQTKHVVLIGAGVGVTPLRALLEDLPQSVRVTVVIRASRTSDLVHHEEIKALVARNGGRLHEVIGSRREVSLDARALRRLIPDVGGSDVYLCGPGGFTDALAYELSRLHVSSDQIHKEEFSF